MDREQLQAIFELFVPNVYFQPPNGQRMEYPCIVYKRDPGEPQYADNSKYLNRMRYQVTVIDRDPDGILRGMVDSLPLCRHVQFFAADNLNHDIFNLYF